VKDMKPAFQKLLYSAMATAALGLGSLPTAFGGGSAPIPVKVLVSKADGIVIAKILDGAVALQTATLNLDVQEVLKGALQVGAVVPVDYRLSAEAARYTTDIARDRGLFFLQNTNGKWSILSVTSGSIPEFRGAFFVLPTNAKPKTFPNGVQASIHERILAELAGALESGGGQSGSGVVDFMWEYRSYPSPAMKALFAQLKTSTNAQLRPAGLRASLANGDPQAFAQVEQGLAGQSTSEVAQIADELQYYVRVADPRAVASLGRLAASQASPARLRKAGLTALARIHTKASLPYLAEFLDDPDAELRSLAVGGMAMFANNVPVGEHEPVAGPWRYRTEETLRYSAMDPTIVQNTASVTFWKSWWAEHRTELQ
jgi:hypothetical protein